MLGNITGGKIEIIGSKKSLVPSKIIKIIVKHGEMSISEIYNVLAKQGDKYNYRSVWQHIKNMDGIWLDIEKKEHEAGKPVIVKLRDIFKGKEIIFR